MTEPGSFTFNREEKALIVSGNDTFVLDKSSTWFGNTAIETIKMFLIGGNAKVDISHLHSVVIPNGNLKIKVTGNGVINFKVPDCQLNKVHIELSGLAHCFIGCSIASLTVSLSGNSQCYIAQKVGKMNVVAIGRQTTLSINGSTMPHFTTVQPIKEKKPKKKQDKVKAVKLKKSKKPKSKKPKVVKQKK